MLEVFHFSYLSFAYFGYNVDRCPKSVYSKIVNDANYSCIWTVKLEKKQTLVYAYLVCNFQWKFAFTCLYFICPQNGKKKSLWIGGYSLKKMIGDIWNKPSWCIAPIIHANANIFRDICKLECVLCFILGLWFF